MLKVSTFAACLLGLLALAIDGAHLATLDNQFTANAESSFKGLARNISLQTGAIRARLRASAPAIVHKTRNIAGHGSAVTSVRWIPATVAKLKAIADQQAKPFERFQHHQPRVAPAFRTNAASLQKRLDKTEVAEFPPKFKSFLAPDNIAAGITGLVLYVLFAYVLIRKRGGLRAFGDRPAL
jgi:hypothetical protein